MNPQDHQASVKASFLASEVQEGEARSFGTKSPGSPSSEILVARLDGCLYALEGRCPHTGGPMALGKLEGNEIVCPWHGARFDVQSGAQTWGPAERGLERFEIRRDGDRIEII